MFWLLINALFNKKVFFEAKVKSTYMSQVRQYYREQNSSHPLRLFPKSTHLIMSTLTWLITSSSGSSRFSAQAVPTLNTRLRFRLACLLKSRKNFHLLHLVAPPHWQLSSGWKVQLTSFQSLWHSYWPPPSRHQIHRHVKSSETSPVSHSAATSQAASPHPSHSSHPSLQSPCPGHWNYKI